jgi:hypothetical protein
MKPLRILVLAGLVALGLWHVLPDAGTRPLDIAFAQSSGTPDCSFVFNFTTTGRLTGKANSSSTAPCVNWGVTYTTTGTLTPTIQFEHSPDNSSWSAVPNTICSSSVQPPCVQTGANPMASGRTGSQKIAAYDAWVTVNVTGASGSGTGTVVIFGYKGNSPSASNQSGGGSVGPTGPTGPTGPSGPSAGPTWIEASCDTPRTQTLAGNSFWSVVALTNWDAGEWQFLPAVDGKLYCTAQVPRSISGTPAAVVLLETASANTASSKAVRWIVSSKNVPNGSTLDLSFTAETAQNITQSTTAYTRTDVTFTLTNQPAASDLLVIEVFRQGSNGGDTLTTLNALVFKVLLGITV